MKATIFDIQRSSYVDGPGIRTTVSVKGCHLNCAWCHNLESRAGHIQRLWYETKCSHCGNGENKHRALGLGEPRTFTVPSPAELDKFKLLLGNL